MPDDFLRELTGVVLPVLGALAARLWWVLGPAALGSAAAGWAVYRVLSRRGRDEAAMARTEAASKRPVAAIAAGIAAALLAMASAAALLAYLVLAE